MDQFAINLNFEVPSDARCALPRLKRSYNRVKNKHQTQKLQTHHFDVIPKLIGDLRLKSTELNTNMTNTRPIRHTAKAI